MKTLIIVPTYNEIENIPQIVPAILAVDPTLELLVVDDNSPDGTGNWVESETKKNNRLHLLKRKGKEGLGKAYLAGFDWALKNGYDWVCEMDADFSHRPQDLLKLLQSRSQADFLIGSRYIPGGSTLNWGLLRKIISRGGSLYTQILLGFGKIQDWTGGFNLWNRKVLESISLDKVFSEGYSFQIELKYRGLCKGFRQLEVPILFEDRRVGKSKMSFRIVVEAFYKVWLIRFRVH